MSSRILGGYSKDGDLMLLQLDLMLTQLSQLRAAKRSPVAQVKQDDSGPLANHRPCIYHFSICIKKRKAWHLRAAEAIPACALAASRMGLPKLGLTGLLGWRAGATRAGKG